MMNLSTATTNPAPPAAVAGAAPAAAAAQPAAPGALAFAQWLGLDPLQGEPPLPGDNRVGGDAAPVGGDAMPAGAAPAGAAYSAQAAPPAGADGSDPAAADGAADPAAAAQDASQLAAMAAPLMALAPALAAALSAAALSAATPQPAKRSDGAGVRAAADAGLRAASDTGLRAAAGAMPVAAAAGGAVPPQAAAADARPPAAAAAIPLPAAAPGPDSQQGSASLQAAGAAPAAAAKHDVPAEPGADRSAATTAGAGWGVSAAAAPAPQPQVGASVALAGPPAAWRQSLHEALGERLNLQLSSHAEQAVIRLDPPNLGRVEISIRHSAGGLEVNISATHGEVLRQLHAVSDGLRNDLAQRQFSEVAVTVSAAPRSAGGAPFGDQEGRGRQRGRDPEELAPGLALREGGALPDSIFSLTGRE